MSGKGGKGRGKGGGPDARLKEAAAAAYAAGRVLLSHNSALHALPSTHCRDTDCTDHPRRGLVTVDSNGVLHANPYRKAEPAAWAWALAHALLHLGFGHVPTVADAAPREQPDAYDLTARCVVVNRFLETMPVGEPPRSLPQSWPDGDEEQLAAGWRRSGIPPQYADCGTAGRDEPDQLLKSWTNRWQTPPDWSHALARALTRKVSAAMDVAGGRRDALTGNRTEPQPWERALNWFVSSYPLLGGIAAGMTLVADAEVARANDISIAAVSARAGEIYVNPLRHQTDEEWQFVLAHEMLHAALRHGERNGARDPFLFNVAADYVINGWLLEMGVGDMPEGLLYDPLFSGMSAEEVYDRITTDLRRARRLATLRGKGRGDVLGEPLFRPAAPGEWADLEEFYRRGLVNGFDLHRGRRGLLPAGLVEEIRALSHPPVPWDARLARWFDEYVPRPEAVRSYARPSRRQAATPDIPRAGRYFPPDEVARCTFGVVLDTSGSMERAMLGKALGAIASYATARDVAAARVVMCDAAPFDAGYLPVTEIAGRVKIRGRGGTVLQPGVDLLLRAEDFPPTAPVLIITDAECDALRVVRREHAYLIPKGGRLPFTPRGPVFAMN